MLDALRLACVGDCIVTLGQLAANLRRVRLASQQLGARIAIEDGVGVIRVAEV